MTDNSPLTIFTIGHSTHPAEYFVSLLKAQEIEVVADVRSRPHSRFAPQFNREALTQLLADHGIRYLFLGQELGGKPPELEKSLADEVVWRYLRSRPQFREGLERLLQEARQARVALLCAEADPARCHRGLLLAPELEGRGVAVRHILADGRVAQHDTLNLPAPLAQKRLF